MSVSKSVNRSVLFIFLLQRYGLSGSMTKCMQVRIRPIGICRSILVPMQKLHSVSAGRVHVEVAKKHIVGFCGVYGQNVQPFIYRV